MSRFRNRRRWWRPPKKRASGAGSSACPPPLIRFLGGEYIPANNERSFAKAPETFEYNRELRRRRPGVLKIAVLFGGDSMERDVSIASASQVVGALRSRGHQVIAYDSGRGRLTAADEQRLFAGKIDRRPPNQAAVSSLPTVVSAPDLADVDRVF